MPDNNIVRPLFNQRFRKEIGKGELAFEFALLGLEALEYLSHSHTEVAPILSDINMPDTSGIERLSQIRHTYENRRRL